MAFDQSRVHYRIHSFPPLRSVSTDRFNARSNICYWTGNCIDAWDYTRLDGHICDADMSFKYIPKAWKLKGKIMLILYAAFAATQRQQKGGLLSSEIMAVKK